MSFVRTPSDSEDEGIEGYNADSSIEDSDSEKNSMSFYYERDASSLAEVWRLQYFGGGVFYQELRQAAAKFLAVNNKVTLLQYDIPNSDVEQHQKMFAQIEKYTLPTDENCFSASIEMPPAAIIQFKYFSGYWRFTKINPQGIFFPADQQKKTEFITQQQKLAAEAHETVQEKKRHEDTVNFDKKITGIAILSTIIGLYVESPTLLLLSIVALGYEYFAYGNNLDSEIKLRYKEDDLKTKDAFRTMTLFPKPSIEPNQTPSPLPRKTYGPQ